MTGHLAGKSPAAIGLYRQFARMVRTCGPVTVVPDKTRIAFQVRMSFAAAMLKRDGFRAIETISPRNHVHTFRIETLDQLDGRVKDWLCEAYAVGEQRHLRTGGGPAPGTSPPPPIA